MKKKSHLGFYVSVIASGIILNALPINDMKFALYKLGGVLQSDVRLRDQVAEHCGSLSARSATQVEKYILEHLPVPSRPQGGPECILVAQSAKVTRFQLRSYWDFQMQVRDINNTPLLDRHFALDFPRPLVLLPIAIFLLALVFEFRGWGIGWTASSYVFLLCGGSLISAFHYVRQGAQMAFTAEQSWTGLFLIMLWVGLCRGRQIKVSAPPATRRQRWINRTGLAAIAFWNPTALTLAGRMLVPFRGAFSRVAPFFTLQVAAVALSLYLLSFNPLHLKQFFSASLLLPRYFTFGLLLFMLLEHRHLKEEPRLWNLPGFWRSLAFIVFFETSAAMTDFWQGTSTLTRIGLALVLSQLVWWGSMDWKRVSREILRTAGPLLVCAVLSEMSALLSMTDLALRLFDPRMHPNGTVFFTFLSGISLGFLTGSFGVAYFAMMMALMKTASLPMVRSALLDGILAGILLSPFSIINWIPAAQFGFSVSQMVVFRFKQLAFPLGIGLLIYAVSTINSVAILMPATFVFLCLVAVVFQLKKSSWRFGNYTLLPDLRNAKH